MTCRQRLLLGIVLAALLLPVLGVAVACLIYPPAYVYRVLAWRDADVGDMHRFASRPLRASTTPWVLPRADEADRVRDALQRVRPGPPLEALLEGTGTQAFVVLQRGRIVYEGYFNGGARDSPVTSFSVAKSFLSLLVGIAVAEGHLTGLDEPITRRLPELAARDPRFAAISVRHLLQMASGIAYEEFPFLHGDDAKTYYAPDLRRLALQHTRPGTAVPGTRFHYNNYHPLLLGLILERATGMAVTDYLQRKLWDPLGMEFGGSWSLDSEASGFEKLESGINARALDFAKLGLLVLHGGHRGALQIVPDAFVHESTAPPAGRARSFYAGVPWMVAQADVYYGLMWWGIDHGGGRHDLAARGNHGQVVFVSPANEVVIVRHGERYGLPGMQWPRLLAALAQQLGAAR